MRAQQPAALALLAVALALCGCDFVELKGMRADLALPVVRDIVRRHPKRLDALANVYDVVDLRGAGDLVEFLVSQYAAALDGLPRMQRARASATNWCDAQVLRALWTCAYWHRQEFKDCESWGFAAASG